MPTRISGEAKAAKVSSPRTGCGRKLVAVSAFGSWPHVAQSVFPKYLILEPEVILVPVDDASVGPGAGECFSVAPVEGIGFGAGDGIILLPLGVGVGFADHFSEVGAEGHGQTIEASIKLPRGAISVHFAQHSIDFLNRLRCVVQTAAIGFGDVHGVGGQPVHHLGS